MSSLKKIKIWENANICDNLALFQNKFCKVALLILLKWGLLQCIVNFLSFVCDIGKKSKTRRKRIVSKLERQSFMYIMKVTL